ncbi:MAG: hypothetical protein ACLFTA_00220 [Candidatus Nanohaloarchaea archaeon]
MEFDAYPVSDEYLENLCELLHYSDRDVDMSGKRIWGIHGREVDACGGRTLNQIRSLYSIYCLN